jgi:SAM-dependent methyltransferase
MTTVSGPGVARSVSSTLPESGSSSIRWRLSDLWRAPLSDLPVRDELIRQYIPLAPETEVLEIGPGSGMSAFRMARAVGALALLEIASDNAACLQRRFASLPNVDVVQGDLCSKELGRNLSAKYDAVIAIEVFEFLSDPSTALRNIAAMLRPASCLFMQFPNYENPAWPTFYRSRHALEAQLTGAGFTDWRIYSLRLSPWSQWLFRYLHEFPLRLYRARQHSQQLRPQRPHCYDETWAFRRGGRLEAIKVPINLYWAAIMILMRMGGNVFCRTECGDEILGKNLFVVARTGGDDCRDGSLTGSVTQ